MIRAHGDFGFRTAADECRPDIADALAVGGARGLAPGEGDAVAFAAGAKVGGRFRKLE